MYKVDYILGDLIIYYLFIFRKFHFQILINKR